MMKFRVHVAPILVFALLIVSPIVSAAEVDLFAYLSSHVDVQPNGVAKYERVKQFGGWAHQDSSKECINTREQVLARAEDPGVALKMNASGCTIQAGDWHDPYTGQEFTKATDVQIDHVVPLKNAYYAGAYAWAPAVRCNYANFLANDFHLQAVSAHENMAKGDRGPDGYMPPDSADHCNYIAAWMKIKTIWQLTSTQAEVSAIQSILSSCPSEVRYMEESELSSQREAASTPIAACANFSESRIF